MQWVERKRRLTVTAFTHQRQPRAARPPEGVGGVELASEPFLNINKLLMASLVRLPDGRAVELGLWTVAHDGWLVGPSMPLLFEAGHIGTVRRAAEQAGRAIPGTRFDEEGMAELLDADEGGLVCDLIRGEDGAAFPTLAIENGTGVASVPTDSKRYLVPVTGYNLGLIMRLLVAAGTPKEFVARASEHPLFLTTAKGAVAGVLVVPTDTKAAMLIVIFQSEPHDRSRVSSTR